MTSRPLLTVRGLAAVLAVACVVACGGGGDGAGASAPAPVGGSPPASPPSSPPVSPPPPAATIAINAATTLQTMSGWEVTIEGLDGPDPVEPRFRSEIDRQAVEEVGINRVRLEVRAGVENTHRGWTRMMAGQITAAQYRPLRYQTVNDNNDPNVINPAGFDWAELDDLIDRHIVPLRQRMAARGESMFVNLCYVAFTSQNPGGAPYVHNQPEEYAEFVLATFQHIQSKYGFAPDAFEALLEPDNGTSFDAALLGRAIAAAGARLRANGFNAKIIAPSTTDMRNAPGWIDTIVATPNAKQYISEFSYHRYGANPTSSLQSIASKARANGVGASMLEWWFNQGTYEVLHEDLTIGENVSWQGASLDTLFDINRSNPNAPTVAINDTTSYHLPYFRSVRAGARRIGASSADAGLAPIAFVNADGRTAVVVKTQGAASFSIGGLPAGAYRVRYTTASGFVESPNAITVAQGGNLTTSIPGRGVIAVVAAGGPVWR